MKDLIRCKSCGFIMEKNRLRDKCPACGVPAKMFEDHIEKVSPFRRLVLTLDIHPVLVHFPQAFTAALLFLSLLGIIVKGAIHGMIVDTIVVLGVALPVTVVFAFAAGLFDGAIRFRRVTTPLLIRKILLGVLFFLLTTAAALVIFYQQPFSTASLLAIAGLEALALLCAALLGIIGMSLLNSKFPG